MVAASLPERRRRRSSKRFRLVLAASLVGGPAAGVACGPLEPSVAASRDAEADPAEAGAAPVVEAAADAPAGPRLRERLSQTGLYTDTAQKVLAVDALAFRPAFPLWSDGAAKERWVRLPPNTTIDTTDPDHWILPVGAQLFKEFSLDGKRLETRLVERVAATGKLEADYWLGAFLWRDDESDADFVEAGASNVRATSHDVPSAEACWSCHIGEPGHALGFTALQLSHELGGLNLATLRAKGLVPSALVDRGVPGDPTARGAVGYLHANCGHCHNENGASWPDTDMVLRVAYGESSVTSARLFTSTVGVATKSFRSSGFSVRIEPGDPDASAVAHRLGTRTDGGAMPPIATKLVDPDGVQRVREWIAELPPRDAGAD